MSIRPKNIVEWKFGVNVLTLENYVQFRCAVILFGSFILTWNRFRFKTPSDLVRRAMPVRGSEIGMNSQVARLVRG